jgi:hypothetical protein
MSLITMRKNYSTKHTRSGLHGWQNRLQNEYKSLEAFEQYCSVYNNHLSLGYPTPEEAWDANPMIQGSVEPSDYCRVVAGVREFFTAELSGDGITFGSPVLDEDRLYCHVCGEAIFMENDTLVHEDETLDAKHKPTKTFDTL